MGILDSIKGLFGGGSQSPAPASSAAPARAAAVKIDRVLVGESLVGDGNEVAHIDLLIGPRGSAVEKAFTNSLTNNKDGFTSLLAVVAPNLTCKPNAMMFNKVTIKGAGKCRCSVRHRRRWRGQSPTASPRRHSPGQANACSSASACLSTGSGRRQEDLRLQLHGGEGVDRARARRSAAVEVVASATPSSTVLAEVGTTRFLPAREGR
jgi:hypothetical protein